MTRKDYILIAQALKESQYLIDSQQPISAECARGRIAKELADMLARDNPRFDRQRFLNACAVQS